MCVATEHGGLGQGPAMFAAVVETLADRAAILRKIAAGNHLTTLAFSERGSRSQFWVPVSQLERRGAGFVTSAMKSWVTSASHADSYVSSGHIAGGAPLESALYLVRKGATGVKVGGRFDGLGLRGNDSTPVTIEGLVVEEGDLVTRPGEGLKGMLEVVLPWFAVGTSAMASTSRSRSCWRSRWRTRRGTSTCSSGARAAGGAPISSAVTRHSLLSLFELEDFSEVELLLAVLGEGTFIDLLRFVEEHAPDEATAELARRARVDETRHVHFGLAHVRHALAAEPSLALRLEAAVRRRAASLATAGGMPAPALDALTVLAARGDDPRAIARGHEAVRALLETMRQNRRKRLAHAGFTDERAEILSQLHTPNFM